MKTMQPPDESGIFLADMLHDASVTQLASPALLAILREKVFARYTSQTAICVEGINFMDQPLKPTDYGHSVAIAGLWPGVDFKPPLYGADIRYSNDWSTKILRNDIIDLLLDYLDGQLELTESPVSIPEALDWVRTGKKAFGFKTPPSRKQRDAADKLFRVEKLLMKGYGELAQKLLRTHTSVYVLLGLTHCIGLHLRFGWSIMWLTQNDTWTTPENVYRAGMNFTHFADAVGVQDKFTVLHLCFYMLCF